MPSSGGPMDGATRSFAVYRRRPTLEAMEACWEAESFALFALLDHLQVRSVDVAPQLVRNVNRREDVPDE